jgi:hypothetical protein
MNRREFLGLVAKASGVFVAASIPHPPDTRVLAAGQRAGKTEASAAEMLAMQVQAGVIPRESALNPYYDVWEGGTNTPEFERCVGEDGRYHVREVGARCVWREEDEPLCYYYPDEE